MKNFLSKLATILGLLITLTIIFFSFKGCVIKVWKSPKVPETYAIHGADGRTLSLIFMPKNETILVYLEDKTKSIEAILARMLGTYGTHYFWKVWSINGPGSDSGWLGIRFFPDGTEPVNMEITVLKKFIQGSVNPTFPNVGDITHSIILFSKNRVKFQGMWLEKEQTDNELLRVLMHQLKPQ